MLHAWAGLCNWQASLQKNWVEIWPFHQGTFPNTSNDRFFFLLDCFPERSPPFLCLGQVPGSQYS